MSTQLKDASAIDSCLHTPTLTGFSSAEKDLSLTPKVHQFGEMSKVATTNLLSVEQGMGKATFLGSKLQLHSLSQQLCSFFVVAQRINSTIHLIVPTS